MIQVTVMITVGENASNGSIISVMNAETLATPHGDMSGVFLQAGLAIDRLAEDVQKRALDQARHWAENPPVLE